LISKFNQNTQSNKVNQSFSGKFSYPRAGNVANLVDSHTNLGVALKYFADKIALDTVPELDVFVRDIPEIEAKIISATTEKAAFDKAKENIKLVYLDSKTGEGNSIGFYLNPSESAATNYENLVKTMKDIARNYFIR